MCFKLRYWAELRSKYKEVFWRVEIAERGYQGSAEEMAFDGSNPLQSIPSAKYIFQCFKFMFTFAVKKLW